MQINLSLIAATAVGLSFAEPAFALVCESEFRMMCPVEGCMQDPNDYIPKTLATADDVLEGYLRDLRGHDFKGHETAFLLCIQAAKRRGGKAVSSNAPDIDTVTPAVPGCPKYLRKSLVEWRQIGNPQLNTWEIRNVSSKILKVTYTDGGNNSPDTINPGGSTQVGLSVGSGVPPYVVRDFQELVGFNRSAKSGQTLQCELAIRPR